MKCTDIYRINSALIQPVRCVTDYRQSVSLFCAECTHTMQPVQHLQCRMTNTITTEHVLNTQCTMCFPSTCQSLNTFNAVSNSDAQHSDRQNATCNLPPPICTAHNSPVSTSLPTVVRCSALLSRLLLHLIFILILLQLKICVYFCVSNKHIPSYDSLLPSASVIQTSQLMLYREIMAVCSEIHTKNINTVCGQNVELLNVKLSVHIVTTGLQRVSYI